MIFHQPVPIDSVGAECLGFCGRQILTDENGSKFYSDCKACGWGQKAFDQLVCRNCDHQLAAYDWMYLAFMALLPLLIHCFFVYYGSSSSPTVTSSSSRQRKITCPNSRATAIGQAVQLTACLIECLMAALCSLLVMAPRGSSSIFELKGCEVPVGGDLKPWYPMFYNPVINFTHTLRCTHEIVYPLYSLPFIYFAFHLLFVVIIRSAIYCTFSGRIRLSPVPFYAAFYALPLIALMQAIFAGILYYSFPYLTLIASLAVNAVHMSLLGRQSIRWLCVRLFSSAHHVMLLTVHMALFAFALYSMWLATVDYRHTGDAGFSTFAMALIPAPAIFFLITSGLTHPLKLNAVG